MSSNYRVTAYIDGKKKQFYGRTKKEAQMKKNEAIRRSQAGLIKSDYTVFDFAQMWIDQKRDSLRPNTVRMYLNALNKHIVPVIGSMKIQDVRYAHCERCLKVELSRSSNDKIRLTLTQLFEYAVINNLIMRSPAVGLKAKGKNAKKVEACTDEEIEQMFTELKDTRFLLFPAIAYYTGMRAAEIRGLFWSDFDTDIVTVQRQLIFRNNSAALTSDLKTRNAYRDIPVPDPLREIIEKHKSSFPCHKKYVICNADGTLLTYQGYKRLILPLGRMGIKPHQLRHTFATKLAENSVDLKLAAYLMGHSDIRTTANIYQSVSNKMKSASIDIINSIFK